MSRKGRKFRAFVAPLIAVAIAIPALLSNGVTPALATVCNDGWISPSTGRGTCSWHGGIATGGYVYIAPKPAKAVKYSSCAKLKSKYPAGVAKSMAYVYKATLLKTPKVWGALYDLNKKLDYNSNGLICESLYVAPLNTPTPRPTYSTTPSPSPSISSSPSPSSTYKPTPSSSPTYSYTPALGTFGNPFKFGEIYKLTSTPGVSLSINSTENDASVEACSFFLIFGCTSGIVNGVWTNLGFSPSSNEKIVAISVLVSNTSDRPWTLTKSVSFVTTEFNNLISIEGGIAKSSNLDYFDVAAKSSRLVKLFVKTWKITDYSKWMLYVADGGLTGYMKIK